MKIAQKLIFSLLFINSTCSNSSKTDYSFDDTEIQNENSFINEGYSADTILLETEYNELIDISDTENSIPQKQLLITKIQPDKGKASELNAVSVWGEGFNEQTEIYFGISKALYPFFISEQIINVITPPIPAGVVDIRAVNPSGETAILPHSYTFESDFAIEQIKPEKGSILGGTPVLVNGSGFKQGMKIFFDGKPALIKEITGDSSLFAITPSHDEGVVDVTAILPSDEQAKYTKITKKKFWTYINDLPKGKQPYFKLIKVTPDSGKAKGGTEVIIHGLGLKDGISIKFGGLPALSVQFKGQTMLSAITGEGSPGPVDVSGFQDGAVFILKNGFNYTSDGTQIFYASPDKGAIAGGTYVKIYGCDFPEHFAVSFGGVQAKNAKRVNSSSITAITPQGKEGFADISVEWETDIAFLTDGFFYFDPVNKSGGVSGEKIDGSVNVTVLDSQTGERLPDAFVILNSDPDSPFKGRTNSHGQITFSSFDLQPPQTVTATKEDYSASTIAGFGGENVSLYINSTKPSDPFEIEPSTPMQCKIAGTVYNVEKYIQIPEGMNGKRKVICAASLPYFFGSNPETGEGAVIYETREYEIISRTGTFAVYCIGGIETEQGDFLPLRMGIHRGVSCMGDDIITGIDIYLTISLENEVYLKIPSFEIEDMEVNEPTILFRLRLDGEGFLPFDVEPEFLKNRLLSFSGIPVDLKGELEGTSYTFYTIFSSKEYGIPYTVNYLKDIIPQPKSTVISGYYDNFQKKEFSSAFSSSLSMENIVLLSTRDGNIISFDGNEWTLYLASSEGEILDLFGIDLMDIFAVGEKGLMLHIEGKSYEKILTPVESDISSVCGNPYESEVYIASEKQIYRMKNDQWNEMLLPSSCTVTDLLCGSSVWALCKEGLILNSEEEDFYIAYEGSVSLNAISKTSNGEMFFAGDEGTYVHYAGYKFITKHIPAKRDILSVLAIKPDFVIFAGEKGMLYLYDGKSYRDFSIEKTDTDWTTIFSINDLISVAGLNPVRIEPVLSFPVILKPLDIPSPYTEISEIWDKKGITLNKFNGIKPSVHRIIMSGSTSPLFWYIIADGSLLQIDFPDLETLINYSPVPVETELKYLNITSSLIPDFTMNYFTIGSFGMEKTTAYSVNFIKFY